MKIKVSYPDASVFKNLFEVISKMVDEVSLEFNSEEMKVSAMDPANVALLQVRFPRDSFTEYTIEEPGSIGINVSVILKLLKRVKRGDRLDIDADDENVNLTVVGIVERKYSLKNLEVMPPEIPEASLTFNTSILMLVDPLREALKDIEITGDQVTFESSDDTIKVYASGEKKYEMTLTRDSEAIIELSIKESSKSNYSVDYLLNTLSLVKVADTVRIEYSSNMPLKLEFDTPGGGKVNYLLAPAA